MAIITFCSSETKETGQTISVAAIATNMAIEHNFKILIVSTSFNDLTLENCFWKYDKIRPTGTIQTNGLNVGLQSGVEGLAKALTGSRNNSEVVKNYSRIVLKDRLDILLSPMTKSYQEYATITPYYSNILTVANQYYDVIFVDLDKKVPKRDINSVLQISDVVVINLTQRLKTLNDFVALREANDFYKRKNVMLAVGKYDSFSKYNKKNIARYLREKNQISVIPYNTLFFEACSEGEIIDYFLKVKNISDETDKNVVFVKNVEEAKNNIIYKLQELQMKM